MLDEDVEEEEEDDDAAEAAGFASDVEVEPDEDEGVEDFDEDDAGELLDEEPRLSFR